MARKPDEQQAPEVENDPGFEVTEIKTHDGTVLRREGQTVTARKSSTVTRLKSQGWKVVEQ